MQETTNKLSEEEILHSVMKTVVARLFDTHLSKLNRVESFDLKEEIEKSTEDLCLIASAQMLALLTEKYSDFFSKKMILKCIGVETNRFKVNNEWRWHAVAVVESISGKWYAFSPANLASYGESYGGVLVSDTLGELTTCLEQQEGGVWKLDDEEIKKIIFDDQVPSFYTTILNEVVDMDDESLVAAVKAYNDALDQDRAPVDRQVIERIIKKLKGN